MPVDEIKIRSVEETTLNKILEFSEALLQGDYTKRIITDFDSHVVARIADNLNRFADRVQLGAIGQVYEQESTVATFIEVISSFANLDFQQKMPVSNNGTILDAISTGINVLGEELEQSVASKIELENERNRLDEAQSIAKTGNWIIQIPSYKVTWSREMYRIFEIDEAYQESIYKLYIKKVHPDDSERLQSSFLESIRSGKNFLEEYRVIANDGAVKYLQSIGNPIANEHGVIQYVTGTLQDITERKILEQTLKQAKDIADEANLAKSKFLASMSHEIRTPLNGIMGLAEMMLLESLTPTHREYLEIIHDSGKNLGELINDILDFSKIESGKLNLERIKFNFKDLVLSNVNRYRFLAEQKGLTLLNHLDDSIPDQLIGDPTRITQIITNLIGNAIKFTALGTIDISFKLVEKNNTEATVQGVVRDTGIGIPADKTEVVFQSFAQADDAVARRYGGSGLGLSIVQDLVQRMHGSITVQSPADEKLNTGAIFTFTIKMDLPTNADKSTLQVYDRPMQLTFKKHLHILIVDDNKVNLMVAKSMVRRFGAKVLTVENGYDAIKKISEHDFDVILMDIQMPGIDGYETTRELRKLNFDKPIIALSANAYDDDVKNSLKAGMNAHVQKPYTQELLFHKIVTCMGILNDDD